MGNKISASSSEYGSSRAFFNNKRKWEQFLLMFPGFIAFPGKSRQSDDLSRKVMDIAQRNEFELIFEKTPKDILLLICGYIGERLGKPIRFRWDQKIEDTGMVFKTVKGTSQKHSVPGYIHGASRYDKIMCGMNPSVKSIHKYEIRCVGVYEAHDSQHGHGKKRIAGNIRLNLKSYGNKWDKPLILALNCYEPVIWHIHADKTVLKKCQIDEIYLTTGEDISQCKIKLYDGLTCGGVVIEEGHTGYGNDSGGGYTHEFLSVLMTQYGDKPLSMIGDDTASRIDLFVGNKHKFAR
eukprot:303039_1